MEMFKTVTLISIYRGKKAIKIGGGERERYREREGEKERETAAVRLVL